MDQLIEFATNNIILVIIWVGLFLALIYSFIAPAFSGVKRLDNHQLTQLINKHEGVVFDIRSEKEFRNGHIIDSINIKPDAVKAGNFSQLEKFKQRPIIVVCAMGNQASTTATKMLKQGFENINILKGGIGAWQSAGLPMSK